MDKKDLAICKKILQKLMKHKNAHEFNAPVDWKALQIPDYPLVIRNPMDFGTIKRNLDQETKYKNPTDFSKDVRLVFTNCYTYNMPGSDISNAAEELEQVFNESFSSEEFTTPQNKESPSVSPNGNKVARTSPKNNKPSTSVARGRPRRSLERKSYDFDTLDDDILLEDAPIDVRASKRGAEISLEELPDDYEEDEIDEDAPIFASPKPLKTESHHSSSVSPYELKRQENIRKNQELLKSLQLDVLMTNLGIKKPPPPPGSTPKRKPRVVVVTERRISKRRKGLEYSPLFLAVKDRDLTQVTELLKLDDTDANAFSGINEETALHLACTIGDYDIAKLLIEHKGIDIHLKDNRGMNAVDIAHQNGFEEIKKILIDAGALLTNPNAPSRQSRPLVRRTPGMPVGPEQAARCTCCHICRSSLTLRPREFKGCSTCPYIVCMNCSVSKLKIPWEEMKTKTDWICEVCLGTCVCSRCITRGPPKWFGHKNPRWKDPDTMEDEKKRYEDRVKDAMREFKHGSKASHHPRNSESNSNSNSNANSNSLNDSKLNGSFDDKDDSMNSDQELDNSLDSILLDPSLSSEPIVKKEELPDSLPVPALLEHDSSSAPLQLHKDYDEDLPEMTSIPKLDIDALIAQN